MGPRKTNVPLAASAAIAVLTITLFDAKPIQGDPGPKPVTVVNTTSQPVPVNVAGTTTIAGTVNANITNAPSVNAVQSGVWSVALSGPVAALPTVPPEPFSAGAEFVTSTAQLHGPVAAGKQLAVTDLVFANQSGATFLAVRSDDCSGNFAGSGSLTIAINGFSTVSVPLSTPIVFSGPCLVAQSSIAGPIRIVHVVGYLIEP